MARVEGRAPNKVSEKVRLAEIGVDELRAKAVIVVCLGIAAGLTFAGMWLPAHELAGEKTTVSLSFTLTITLALGVAEVATVLLAVQKGRVAKQAEGELRQRRRDVKELQRRLRDAGLPDDLTR